MSRKRKEGAEGGWAGYPPGYTQPGYTQPGSATGSVQPGRQESATVGPRYGAMAPDYSTARPGERSPGAGGPPAGAAAAPRSRTGSAFFVVLVMGVLIGLLWVWLTPDGQAVYTGSEWLPQDQSLWFRQDMTFAIMAAIAGLITGTMMAGRAGNTHPLRRLIALLIASLLGSAIAVGIGRMLRPAADATKTGATGPAPLDLHALGFFGTWSLFACATCAIILILRGLRGR